MGPGPIGRGGSRCSARNHLTTKHATDLEAVQQPALCQALTISRAAGYGPALGGAQEEEEEEEGGVSSGGDFSDED